MVTQFVPTQLEPIVSPAPSVAKESRPQLQIKTDPKPLESFEDMPPAPPPKSAPVGGRNSPGSNRRTPSRKNSSNTLTRLASAFQSSTEQSSTEPIGSKSPEPKAYTPAALASASPPVHKKQLSHAGGLESSPSSELSVVNRGRPIKRAQSFDHPDRKLSASSSPTHFAEPKEVWKLPSGLKRTEAIRKLNEHEKQKLQHQAASQADKFEILSERDVATLSKVPFCSTLRVIPVRVS